MGPGVPPRHLRGTAGCSPALPQQLETKGTWVVGAGMDFLPAEVLAASLISEDTFKVVLLRILKCLHYTGYVEIASALMRTLQL